jgi:hypothetical protein
MKTNVQAIKTCKHTYRLICTLLQTKCIVTRICKTFPEKLTALSWSRHFAPFMESDDLLTSLQDSATGFYPEPVEISPKLPTFLP